MNLKYDWRHSRVVDGSPGTLFQLATLKIALNFWNNELNDVKMICIPWTMEMGDLLMKKGATVRKTQSEIVSLEIPENCKESISQVVSLIRYQLEDLLDLLPREFKKMQDVSNFLKEKIRWTPLGTIDITTTAKRLTDTDIDVKLRFEVAVKFCLEDRVNTLSVQMPPDYLENNENLLPYIQSIDGATAAREYFKIEEFEPNYLECFKRMLYRNNLVACQYFWQYLTDEEQLNFLEADHLLPTTHGRELLFFFTLFDREKKLQVLQNEDHCNTLLSQITSSKIPVFDVYIKDVLRFMKVESVVNLLDITVLEFIEVISASKKKYLRRCTMILQFLSKECEITTLDTESNEMLMNAMCGLMREAEFKMASREHSVEIDLLKDFIESVSSEWLREWLSLRCDDFESFLQASLRCGLIETLLGSAFPNAEERKTAIDEYVIDCIIIQLFKRSYKKDDTYRVLIFIFSDFEAVENYKIKLLKERGYSFFSKFFEYYKWEAADKFVHWCFTTKEEIVAFYSEFLRSESFGGLFEPPEFPNLLEPSFVSPVRCTVSLIKSVSLGYQLDSTNLVLDACLTILSKHFMHYFVSDHVKSENLFDALDKLLLASAQDDQEKLVSLKKQFATYKSKTLHIPLPLETLHEQINIERKWHKGSARAKLWRRMIKEFFTWISSSDEKLMAEMEQKFWNSEKILEAEKSFD